MIRLALSALLLSGSTAIAADWPQWRGPDRSNVSNETGLAKEWPKDGPPLAWKATGLGDGVVPVSVVGGRVFTTGNVEKDVVLTALSAKDGKPLWTAKLGLAANESSIMRWLSQMAPTVDGNHVFAVTSNGDYVCLAADTGKEIWRKHYQKDFEGKKGAWGFCDYPFVDGDNLILTPSGEKNTVVAVKKKTGETVWSCSVKGAGSYGHAVLMPAEFGGTKQYITHLAQQMISVSAADGKLLWSYTGMKYPTATTHATVVHGDSLFYANGYGSGHVQLKPAKKDEVWVAEEVYRQTGGGYMSWLGSTTRVGDHLFINSSGNLLCLEWKTGNKVWAEKLGNTMYTVADGKFFIRTQTGKMILATADAKEYRELSQFAPPRPDKGMPAWTFPVVANGHLYVREYDTLLCYDVRDPNARKEKEKEKAPDAVFVPTPPDVVKRMLELAAVKKGDVVYDLGSGDGRIVIAAAKTHGCKAVGVEIDEELVAMSRDRAKEAGVEKLATFDRGDLFDADFSTATVVALYILPAMSQKLIPKLDKLKPGSRVVSHCFAIPGVVPDKVVKITSEEDDVERSVYLYTIPLTREKPAAVRPAEPQKPLPPVR